MGSYGDVEKHGVSLKVVGDLKEVAFEATLRFGVGPYTNQFTISVAKDFSLLFSPPSTDRTLLLLSLRSITMSWDHKRKGVLEM